VLSSPEDFAPYRHIGLCHRDVLEAADASAIAAFRLWYPPLALFVEEAGLVDVHHWKDIFEISGYAIHGCEINMLLNAWNASKQQECN
jgi:hypothetical protein